MKKTGTGGGKKCKFDAIDNLVFEIIGTESPVLDGLPVPESSGSDSAELDGDIENIEPTNDSANHNVEDVGFEENIREGSFIPARTKPGPKPGLAQTIQDLNRLKALKIQRQLNLCEREERIKDLEILKLEKSLDLPPSEYTRKFYNPQSKNSKPH